MILCKPDGSKLCCFSPAHTFWVTKDRRHQEVNATERTSKWTEHPHPHTCTHTHTHTHSWVFIMTHKGGNCSHQNLMRIYLHHMLILKFNMCYILRDVTGTMMDDFINQVQHEEPCSTCSDEKAITAEIILIYTQMPAHASLSERPLSASFPLTTTHCFRYQS